MTTQVKNKATSMLDRLIELDKITTTHFYEMGQLLSSIRHGKLWDVLGYDSFQHLVKEELSFTPSTAHRYGKTYDHLVRLKYNKTTALKLLMDFGYTSIADVLPTIKQPIGTRALANRIKSFNEENHQVNFTVNKAEYEALRTALIKLGAEQTEKGRFVSSTPALMEMVYTVLNGSRKKAA